MSLLLAGAIFSSVTEPAFATAPEERYARVRDAYLALRQDTERQRFRHNYLRIIEDFESFVSDHPRHTRSPDALYNAGNLAWELYKVSRVGADLRRAKALFTRLADDYPQSSLADDALFLKGRAILEHGGDPAEAYLVFQSVVDRFPQGDMVGRAREMLVRLADQAPASSAPAAPAAVPSEPARRVARTSSWQGPGGEGVAQVGAAVIEAGNGLLRVSLPVSEPVRFREGEVPADPSRSLPRRLYIDLQPASLGGAPAETAVTSGGVSRVRVGQFSPDIVRVVIDVREGEPLHVFPMLGVGSIIIDITGEDTAPDPVMALLATGATETPRGAVNGAVEGASGEQATGSQSDGDRARRAQERLRAPQEFPLSVQAGLKVRRVVIDPGHGGHDVGAVGPSGLQEKEVNLAIAEKLGERLAAHGLEVIHTRTEDVYVPLEERTAVANSNGADLFISIHANASTRRDRRGVSTYYLDVTSDRYAMRLAARENAAAERSVGELQLILADLTTRHNTDESARLASRIQENLVSSLSSGHDDVRDLGVRYAIFYVLLGARMPSVLVETSFISNPVEERRLRDEGYRDEVAEGVFRGIVAFIEERNRLALGD